MQIVIEIPEDLYEGIERRDGALETEYVCDELMKAVDNGTPLPEGHGGLVYMSEVIVKLMQYYDGNKTIGQCLDEVHTVIEADGGGAE